MQPSRRSPYDVESHTWYRELDGGKVQIGMTQVAVALAGKLSPSRRRRSAPIAAGKSCATVESGKWVGSGEVRRRRQRACNDALKSPPRRSPTKTPA